MKEKPKALILQCKTKERENDEETLAKVEFKKPNWNEANHIKLMYIKTHMEVRSVSRILVDNKATVNVLPSTMLSKLGKYKDHLLPIELTITNFTRGVTRVKGILPINLMIGNMTSLTTFFVVETLASYNALIG